MFRCESIEMVYITHQRIYSEVYSASNVCFKLKFEMGLESQLQLTCIKSNDIIKNVDTPGGVLCVLFKGSNNIVLANTVLFLPLHDR